MALKESFEWAPPGLSEVPKANLLKLIAKTEATTYHPTDPNYPVRKFNAKELELAARTLIGRPIGRNHESMPISGAYVLDAEYSAKESRVEAIAYTPTNWVSKVRKGDIKRCSIEYTWRGEKRNGGVEFEGLVFTRVDLLEDRLPGDASSAVMLFEAADKDTHTSALLTEVKPLVEQEPPPVPLTDEEIAAICKHYGITREQYDAEPEKYPKPAVAEQKPPPAPTLTDEEIIAICEHYGITREQYDAEPEKYPKVEQAKPPAAGEPKTDEEIAAICAHYGITPEEYAANPEKYPLPKLGEPFGDYLNMDDCIAKNSDKADPAAYCATIMRAIESYSKLAEDGRPDKAWWDRCVSKAAGFADDPARMCGWAWTNDPSMGESKTGELKTLQEAFQRVVTENNTLKIKQGERINAAKEFAHNELKEAVEAVLPKGRMIRDPRLNRMLHEVRGVLNEPIQTT